VRAAIHHFSTLMLPLTASPNSRLCCSSVFPLYLLTNTTNIQCYRQFQFQFQHVPTPAGNTQLLRKEGCTMLEENAKRILSIVGTFLERKAATSQGVFF
jgi:hypothetical protein